MNRDLIYFTLALLALYLVFDQFAGNKHLGKLSKQLWNSGSTAAGGVSSVIGSLTAVSATNRVNTAASGLSMGA